MRQWMGALAAAAALIAPPAAALDFLTEENPPLNFMREGQVAGTATAVLREMAQRAKVPADFRILPWSEAFAKAQSDAGTCVYSTVRNTERLPLFQWVGPVVRGEWSLFGREGFPVQPKHADELKSFRIGVVNDARAPYLRSRGFANLVVAERSLDLAAMLTTDPTQFGRIDLWLAQSGGALTLARQAGVKDLKVVFGGMMSQDYWLACNLKVPTDFVRGLAAALSAMRKDGSYRKLAAPPQ